MEPGVGQTVQDPVVVPSWAAQSVASPVQTAGSQVSPSSSSTVIENSQPQSPLTPAVSADDPVSQGSSSVQPQSRGVRGVAIDLLPEMSENQVKKIEKKGKSNVFAVLLVLTVFAVTVGVLLMNLITKNELERKNEKLIEVKENIVSLQYIELKQATLVTKVNAYKAVKDFDFSPDIVLAYLNEVAESLSFVRTIDLNENLEFSISGKADSFINVARLWHDMSGQRDYFKTVSLDSVVSHESEDGETIVDFTFSGEIVKENISKL